MGKERKLHLDLLRILATYSIVLLHTASKCIGGKYQDIMLVYDGLVRWAVPTFVMISGSIFLDENYNVSIGKMWKKSFHLFIAMFFWTCLYCIFEYIRGTDHIIIRDYLITGYWHMWYVWLTIGLYIITPFLREIIKNKDLTKYFLILSISFTIIIPTIRDVVLPLVNLSDNGIIKALEKNNSSMNLQFVMGYTGLYVLGHYLDKTEFSFNQVIICAMLAIVGFGVNICGNVIFTHEKGALTQVFDNSLGFNVLLECIGLYVFFKYLNKKLSDEKLIFVKRLSSFCFGAYLVHLLFRELLDYYMGWNAELHNPVIFTPLLAFLIFCLSIITSFIMHKIPKINKWIV